MSHDQNSDVRSSSPLTRILCEYQCYPLSSSFDVGSDGFAGLRVQGCLVFCGPFRGSGVGYVGMKLRGIDSVVNVMYDITRNKNWEIHSARQDRPVL